MNFRLDHVTDLYCVYNTAECVEVAVHTSILHKAAMISGRSVQAFVIHLWIRDGGVTVTRPD